MCVYVCTSTLSMYLYTFQKYKLKSRALTDGFAVTGSSEMLG